MGLPRPLLHLFSSFQTHITNFTTNKCEKCPSSTRCRDSNPQPPEREPLPITTRPGLLPKRYYNLLVAVLHNRYLNNFSLTNKLGLKYKFQFKIEWGVVIGVNVNVSMHIRTRQGAAAASQCIVGNVTIFGEIPPLWQIFKNLWQYI